MRISSQNQDFNGDSSQNQDLEYEVRHKIKIWNGDSSQNPFLEWGFVTKSMFGIVATSLGMDLFVPKPRFLNADFVTKSRF